MVQLTTIIAREITQRYKYRWHVTTEKYINVSIKRCSNLFVKY